MPSVPDLSRRRLLGGGVAVLATLGGSSLLAACGGSEESAIADADTGIEAEEAPWTYTDGLGREITLDARPTRIAAYGDAAAALMSFGITPVAIFHYMDPADDAAFEDLDLDGIEIVGTTYGEIDLEQLLVTAAPDLVVTATYTDDPDDLVYGFKDQAQVDTITGSVPIAAIVQQGTALDVIRANEELVSALGIDVEGGQVAEDRAEFERASAELTEAAASGLTVLPVYGEAANLYYGKAPDDPALAYYEELGVDFVDVTGGDFYWEVVSWENADTYEADIVLYSVRDSYTPEQLADEPTFARLAAVQQDQLRPWKFTSMDYPSQTTYLRELAGWLSSDRKIT